MWSSLQELLPRAAGKYKMAKTLKAIEVCREYRRIAPQVLPADSLENAVPISFKDGTLIIGVNNSSWAQHLHMRTNAIKKSLKEHFGTDVVKKIKIQVTADEM